MTVLILNKIMLLNRVTTVLTLFQNDYDLLMKYRFRIYHFLKLLMIM